GTLYVGTDLGVYTLPSGTGAPFTWTRFGDALPNVQVADVELDLAYNMLLVGTYGRSMYQLFLSDTPPVVAPATQPVYGALRATSGTSIWAGPVHLIGDAVSNTVIIAAAGSQSIQNGIVAAQLNLVGTVSDF